MLTSSKVITAGYLPEEKLNATIRTHIKPGLSAIRLDALNTHLVQNFYNSLSKPAKDRDAVSPKTVKNVHGILHKALQQAIANGYIRMNPTNSCILPRIEKKELQPEQALQMQSDGIDLEDFLKLTDAGLKTDLAAKLVTQIHELKPEAGKDRVTDVQKWRAACAVSSDLKEQIAALEMVMEDTAFRKLNIGYEHGVDPAAYVRLREILPQFDANGSGSYSHDEIEAAINSMSASGLVLPGGDGTIFYLTTTQKAALWQLWSTSSSAKNNPYDTDIGWAVIEAKKAE